MADMFSLFCFLSIKRALSKLGKIFFVTSKALYVLEKVKVWEFRILNLMTLSNCGSKKEEIHFTE